MADASTNLSIYSAVREAYQSQIGQRILNSSFRVHLNPNFRESGLHHICIQPLWDPTYPYPNIVAALLSN